MRRMLIMVLIISSLLIGCEANVPLYTRSIYNEDCRSLDAEDASSYYICIPTENQEAALRYLEDKKISNSIAIDIREVIDRLIVDFYYWNYAQLDSVMDYSKYNYFVSETKQDIIETGYYDFIIEQVKKYKMVYYIPSAMIMPGDYIREYRNESDQVIYRIYVLLDLNVTADERFYQDNFYLSKGSTMLAMWIYIKPESMSIVKIIENYITSDNVAHTVELGV